MKHFPLVVIMLIALNSQAQQTYVPDDNFETFLEFYGMGNGIPDDDSVTTANISGVASISPMAMGITDLTGIEGFTSLTSLGCSFNQLTSLDLSQNPDLYDLDCYQNQLTSLNLSQNSVLTVLDCASNQLTSLNVSQNPNLKAFYCAGNLLTSLDVSQNPLITTLACSFNPLECLNVKSGNNAFILNFQVTDCPTLTCIQVDNAEWSILNWTYVDPQISFSNYCSIPCSVGIEALHSTPKQLLKIVDLMGRETPYRSNTVLIYMYSDGTIERVFALNE
ncbi:MAG: Leucine-rich repeat (LRR) protein [Crocinitomicaceae bacterium]|jgi:Leucine-rich repeat (LRR) protein